MPNMGKLFTLHSTVVRVTFKAANFFKEKQKGARMISKNRVDDFEAKCGFDSDHLETSMVRLTCQRSCCVKLGHCDETPRTIWRKHKKEMLA